MAVYVTPGVLISGGSVFGVHYNFRRNTGLTPLISLCNGMSSGRCESEFLNYLFTAGAKPNLTLNTGDTALSIAVSTNWGTEPESRLRIIEILLSWGADPNFYCRANKYNCSELSNHNYEMPPIVGAICQDDSKLVEMLIEYGADYLSPVRVSQYGIWYPIDYAVKYNKRAAEKVLIKYGAEVNRNS